MTLDFARIGALLERLPADVRPTGTLQLLDVAAPYEPNPTVPTLIFGDGVAVSTPPDSAALATIRRGLSPAQPAWVLGADGPAVAATVGDMAWDTAIAVFLPAVEPEDAERSMAGLRLLVHRLRAPGGCPWDREQTAQSLTRYVLEEAYEVVDAIQHHGSQELAEELGDLLLQVYLQADLAEEEGTFGLNDVVEQLMTKLIRRHPHVFADVSVSGAADVETNWEALKKIEKGERVSVLDGIPRSLPALLMAAELQKRMRKAGFEWADRAGAEAKLVEELAELRDAPTPEAAAAELGDVLFVLTGLAAWHGATAEDSLRGTNEKVEARFRHVEAQVRARGQQVKDVPLPELVALWNEAKSLDRDRTPA
jgi:tetrapyrrole methylase family protein/MazG family protein